MVQCSHWDPMWVLSEMSEFLRFGIFGFDRSGAEDSSQVKHDTTLRPPLTSLILYFVYISPILMKTPCHCKMVLILILSSSLLLSLN